MLGYHLSLSHEYLKHNPTPHALVLLSSFKRIQKPNGAIARLALAVFCRRIGIDMSPFSRQNLFLFVSMTRRAVKTFNRKVSSIYGRTACFSTTASMTNAKYISVHKISALQTRLKKQSTTPYPLSLVQDHWPGKNVEYDALYPR